MCVNGILEFVQLALLTSTFIMDVLQALLNAAVAVKARCVLLKIKD
jgi:hypothetical protein